MVQEEIKTQCSHGWDGEHEVSCFPPGPRGEVRGPVSGIGYRVSGIGLSGIGYRAIGLTEG